jgi:hypothetical protein
MEKGKYFKIFSDDSIENLHILFLNEKIVEARYSYKDVFVKNNFNACIYIESSQLQIQG